MIAELRIIDVFDAAAGVASLERQVANASMALFCATGIYSSGIDNVAEDNGSVLTEKACRMLGWDAGWRPECRYADGKRGEMNSGVIEFSH